MPGHTHQHDHVQARQGRSLIISIGLNLGFSIAELIFGLIANSLALVTDAMHDASDAVSLGMSYFGFKMAQRAPNARRTFGYRKLRILTAFLNAVILFGLTALVVRAAIIRIISPEPVRAPVLVVMAIVGVIVNGLAVLLLRQDRQSLNIRAAMWHLLEDFLGWFVVLIGGVLMTITGWSVVDPILSLIVSAFVLWGAYSVFRESASILIDSTPHDLSFDTVRKFITGFDPSITGIHDLHIWTLGEGERALMAHLLVKDATVSSYYPMLSKLEAALTENFSLKHVTLELEFEQCKSGENVCIE